jgi:anaerobic magnesium-protoporphyrin IX monomethyl ester cyclase
MKVNLIIPPDTFLGDGKRDTALGILYIAAVTRDAGYDVSVTDLRGESDLNNLKLNSSVYGFTSSTPNHYFTSNLAKKIKSQDNQALTVLGGMHATAIPKEIGMEFDKVIVGEGENSFLQLLKDIKENKNQSQRFYESEQIKDLDSIPFPARDLIPYDSAFSKNSFSVGGEYTGTIITSRGCPNNCSFCGSQSMWGRKVRFRSAENVITEIKNMKDNYGIKYFKFLDDTMVLRKKRLEELCNGIKPLGIVWRASTRVDCADVKSLRMMKEAGCVEVGYGIESLDQEVLDKNHKGIKMEQIYQALESTRKVGLNFRLFFIIGLPGEKQGYSKRLEEFLDKTNPYGVSITTFVPFPGSQIFYNPEKWGIKLKPLEFEKYHNTLGLREGELKRPLVFEHDILSENQIQKEREESLRITLNRGKVKNF